MSRANGYLIFFYCCLLFLAGVVFGFIFTKGGEIGLVTFLSAASSLATIGAALTAIYALHAWYPQFKHTEKYKLIKEVQLVASNSGVVRDFIYSLKAGLVAGIDSGSTANGQPYAPIPQAEMTAWWRHMDALQYAWRNMCDLLSENEIRAFTTSPDDIEQQTKDLVSEVMDVAYEDNADNRRLKLIRRAIYGAEAIALKYDELDRSLRILLKDLSS